MEEKEKNTVEANSKETAPKVKKEKKAKNSDEIEKLKEELNKAEELLKRTAAEFDNFKKRNERERLNIAEYAKASVIKELLPVIDNALRASAADSSSADFSKGLEMIIKQFLALPEKVGAVTLANVGEPFDPNFHDAVMHVEDENLKENSISEVLQQGYKIGDTVIRPAMVKVAN